MSDTSCLTPDELLTLAQAIAKLELINVHTCKCTEGRCLRERLTDALRTLNGMMADEYSRRLRGAMKGES